MDNMLFEVFQAAVPESVRILELHFSQPSKNLDNNQHFRQP